MLVGLIVLAMFWRLTKTGKLGQAHFWVSLVSFNLIFLPLFLAGEMPRRVHTYEASDGWEPLNLAATIGAFTFGFAQLLMLYNLASSLRRGPPASADSWHGHTLEWHPPTPPIAAPTAYASANESPTRQPGLDTSNAGK